MKIFDDTYLTWHHPFRNGNTHCHHCGLLSYYCDWNTCGHCWSIFNWNFLFFSIFWTSELDVNAERFPRFPFFLQGCWATTATGIPADINRSLIGIFFFFLFSEFWTAERLNGFPFFFSPVRKADMRDTLTIAGCWATTTTATGNPCGHWSIFNRNLSSLLSSYYYQHKIILLVFHHLVVVVVVLL